MTKIQPKTPNKRKYEHEWGPCCRCRRIRKIRARRLCNSCYTYFARKGIIAGKGILYRNPRFTWTPANKVRFRELRAKGVTVRQIAVQLGITHIQAKSAVTRYKFYRTPAGDAEQGSRRAEEREVNRFVREGFANLPDWWDSARAEYVRKPEMNRGGRKKKPEIVHDEQN